MTNYLKVASLRRGAIDPPEPCSEEENRALNHARAHEDAFMIWARDWAIEARPFKNSENFRSRRRA